MKYEILLWIKTISIFFYIFTLLCLLCYAYFVMLTLLCLLCYAYFVMLTLNSS